MPRGSGAQETLLNNQAGTSFGNAQTLYGQASSGYGGVLANPGYTPGQINSQTIAATTPYAAQKTQAVNALQRRAATSGNSAGIVSGEDMVARQAASGESQAQLSVANNAANKSLSERDEALKGISGLYGPSLSSASSLYGGANQALAGKGSQTLGYISAVLGDAQKAASAFAQG